MINFSSKSPYKFSPKTSRFTGLMNWPVFTPQPTDSLFVITTEFENKPYKLANYLYGSDEYWWVFSVRNPEIVDPIDDLKVGITIIIPSKDTVEKAIGE